jgi:hypothetical protein
MTLRIKTNPNKNICFWPKYARTARASPQTENGQKEVFFWPCIELPALISKEVVSSELVKVIISEGKGGGRAISVSWRH